MHQQQRDRAHAVLRAQQIEYALFASGPSVTWLTGFATQISQQPHPFAGAPALVWYAAGEWSLIVFDGTAELAAADSGLPVISYQGYTIDEPINPHRHLLEVIRNLSKGIKHIGIEEHVLPLYLRSALPNNVDIRPIDGILNSLRMVKTSDELVKLRASFALNAVGHEAARAAIKPGMSELDVWAAIESAIVKEAGTRVPLGNDCTIGRRAHQGGWPQNERILPGDSFVLDLSTRLYGYWSDSCATYYAGTPSRRQVALHETIAEALDLAISLVRPGAIACEIDRQVREFVAKAGYPVYGHHTGHGVGTSQHEEPRIVPYNTIALEPNMIVMVEPGVYFPGDTGIRLEHALLVTNTGAEILTKHPTSLSASIIGAF
jgi:Xaa-Pro dipeptidase